MPRKIFVGGAFMKREVLKELGLSDEQIESVMAEYGKSTTSIKAQTSAAEEQITALNAQLAERDKDIKDLKKASGDNEELKQKYSDLESKYKTDKANLEQQIADSKLNHAVDMALNGKVHDASIVRGLLDREKLSFNDKGELQGLDDQLNDLKESKAFLFVEQSEPKQPHFEGGKPTGTENNVEAGSTAEMTAAFLADIQQ